MNKTFGNISSISCFASPTHGFTIDPPDKNTKKLLWNFCIRQPFQKKICGPLLSAVNSTTLISIHLLPRASSHAQFTQSCMYADHLSTFTLIIFLLRNRNINLCGLIGKKNPASLVNNSVASNSSSSPSAFINQKI